MKVVLVDDNPDLTDLMHAAGRLEGVETVCFTSSPDALSYLDDHDADVAIIDLELPIMDGLRLAKEIRKNEEIHPDKKPVKMVFYTAQTIDDTIERVAEKVGVTKRHIYQKPYDTSLMLRDLKGDFGEA